MLADTAWDVATSDLISLNRTFSWEMNLLPDEGVFHPMRKLFSMVLEISPLNLYLRPLF